MLSPTELRLGQLERWSLVHTIQKQTVAAHCFNVAVMAPRIAEAVFGWGPSDSRMYALMRLALMHDQVEQFSGDFPSMVKDCVDEDTLVERYHDMLEILELSPTISDIVKMADLVDAIIFLHMEISMGNQTVRKHLIYMRDKLQKHKEKCGFKHGSWQDQRIETFFHAFINYEGMPLDRQS